MANLRPTFHESWYRVAELRARLRPSAQISRQYYRGDRWYVVRDPAGNQYHRLSSAAYRFVGLLDGSRTVAEAWDLAGGVLADDAPTQPEVVQILTQLHAANLLEANVTADAGVLLRRHKQMMKKRLQGRLMNILFPRIPLWDLDSFLVRWMPIMRIFLSRIGVFVWLAVIIGAIAAIAPEWQRLKMAANNAIEPGNWPFLWAVFVIIKLIHELGHAFTCRRFGGEVHELGIMFLVFVPAPYVDASSAWSLPSKWQRILVGAGGMIFELFVAAICAFIWLYTADTSLVNKLAYNTMLIASVSTIIFNANPLLRYDGYYMLSDWLEIPNLKQKSKEYTHGLIKRHIFRVKSPIPLPPPGQRFWLFIYCVTSGAYQIFIGVMIILVVSNQVPVLGILMAIGGVITWIVVPIGKTLNYLLLDAELHRKRPRAIAFSLAVVGAIVVLIGLIRFPMRFEAPGFVEPERKITLRVRTPGFVQADGVKVKDGQKIAAGEPILICYEKNLETEIVKLEAQLRELDAQLQQALVMSQSERFKIQINIDAVKKRLELYTRQREDLTIRAPFDGIVVAPMIHEMPGRFLKQGEEIAQVIQSDPLVVRVVVGQEDAHLLFPDETVWSPLADLPGLWRATWYDVAKHLAEKKVTFSEEPPADRRQIGDAPDRVLIPETNMLFDKPAGVEIAFENNRVSIITATYKDAGAFDSIKAIHQKEFGAPRKDSSSTKPSAATRHEKWLVEKDVTALDIELSALPAGTVLKYRMLGRKADVRLVSGQSVNLEARMLTRIPAAKSELPHAIFTHMGGGDHQNDPSDPSGKKGAVPTFEVKLRLANNGEKPHLPGQRAYVRFTMEKNRPLIWQWGRRFWQLIQTQSAQNKWM